MRGMSLCLILMPAEEAVFTAAVARTEVRKSLARMEYHLTRGAAGVRGVDREIAFLDGLGRQSARLGAKTAGGANVTSAPGLGRRARTALVRQQMGQGASAGRIKSGILAEFSQDTMSASREWTYDGEQTWIWTTNASACAACLDNHGKTFKGAFQQMHPSCLCFPQPPDEAAKAGVKLLTSRQIVQTLVKSNNPAFRKVAVQIQQGAITIDEAAAAATRLSGKGRARWRAALHDQSQRARTATTDLENVPGVEFVAPPTATPEPATILTDVPTAAEVTTTPVVRQELNLLQTVQDSGHGTRLAAAKHKAVLDDATKIFDQAIDNDVYRARVHEAFQRINSVETVSRGSSNVVGSFGWAGPTGHPATRRTFTFNMRRQIEERAMQYSKDKRAWLAERGELSRLRFQAQTATGQADIDRQLKVLATKEPIKKDYKIYTDTQPIDIADTMVHEGFHAIDEITEFAHAKSAHELIEKEIRAIAGSKTDPNALAFRYAAAPSPSIPGVEAAAETVRMYFMGTGEMATSVGVAPITATEWRALYPNLAKWVEEVALKP